MRSLFLIATGLLLGAAIARAGDVGSSSQRGTRDSCGDQAGSGLTVGRDPFRSGDHVVRDRDTGRPFYRVEPDPFHPGWQRVGDYNTGQPLREVRPDPFNADQSVIDDQ